MPVDLKERGVNVNNIVIDEPNEAFNFDSVLDADDTFHFKAYFNDQLDNGNICDCLDIASSLAIGDKESLLALTLNSSFYSKVRREFRHTKKRLEDPYTRKNYYPHLEIAAQLKLLSPKEFGKLGITSKQSQRIREAAEMWTAHDFGVDNNLEYAAAARIIVPDLIFKNPYLRPLGPYSGKFVEEYGLTTGLNISVCDAANTRIISEEMFRNLGIDSGFLETCSRAVKALRTENNWLNGNNWRKLAEFIRDFRIITADEIKVTEDGLKIINHLPMNDSNNFLPEVRSF